MTIFGITSSINGSIKGLYSEDSRFEQTISTIISIRKIFSDAYIILIDNSEISEKHRSILEEKVNLFLHSGDDFGQKSKNEANQMIYLIDAIKNIEYDLFYKISGRYLLTDNFDSKKHLENEINFRKIPSWQVGNFCFYTTLYSFGKNKEKVMLESYQDVLINNYIDIEHGLCYILGDKINEIDHLGVAGNIAPTGEFIEH
jgi:hypothetical protein